MPRRLSAEECEARYEALGEAADHLRLTWTHDPVEIEQGLEMADWLDGQAEAWLREARRRKSS